MTASVLPHRLRAGSQETAEPTAGSRAAGPSRRLVLAALAASVLGGCKILPIAREGEATEHKFSGADFVDKQWTSDVMPIVRDKAHPLEQVLDAVAVDLGKAGTTFGNRPADEGSPWSFIVKGHAVVKEKNTASRAGTLLIEVVTAKGPVPVVIQIGPVIKGNALRDAMPFINFQGFTNQIEFAEVGRAFNARALTEFAKAAEAVTVGQDVAFAGAFSLNAATDKVLLTPVLLGPAGGSQ